MNPGYSTHIIDSYVYEVTDRDDENRLAVAWVDSTNLGTVASLEGVRSIEEVIPPVSKYWIRHYAGRYNP